MWSLRNKRKDGIIISTIEPTYMAWYGKFETAKVTGSDLQDFNPSVSVLEGYETKEEAIAGHQKYLKMTTEELNKITPIG